MLDYKRLICRMKRLKGLKGYKLFYDVIYGMWSYLGQNFLIDAKVRIYIAEHIQRMYQDLACETLIEIGPGKGSITKLIQTVSDNFFVVDMDPTFYDNWQLTIDNWQFILSDILKLDVEAMLKEKVLDPRKTLIVWNLPYYITSPILRKFFSPHDITGNEINFAWGIFMVQDEVGQKIKSDAKKKSYLWRLLNFGCDIAYLKWVSAKCFKPIPKVKSCLIQLQIKHEKLPIDRERFIDFLESYAPFSRKTLGAIQTMLAKHSANTIGKNRTRSDRIVQDGIPKKKSDIIFIIPESLQKKRLEELDRIQIQQILR